MIKIREINYKLSLYVKFVHSLESLSIIITYLQFLHIVIAVLIFLLQNSYDINFVNVIMIE